MLFVASIKLVPLLGFSFVPATDTGTITISAATDSGLTLQAEGEKAKEIEKRLQKYPEIKHLYTTVGSNNISIYVKMNEKQEREKSSKQIASEIREDLNGIPGIELAVQSSLGPGGGSKDVSFVILGTDQEAMQAFALKAKKMLSEDPQAKDVRINVKTGKTEAKLEVDRDKVTDLGVDTSLSG